MIQRIQTLFLAGAAAAGMVLFYLPMFSYTTADEVSRHEFFIGENIFLTSLNSLGILLALVTVFMYKNRLNQLKICSLNMLLVSVFIVSNFYFSDKPVSAEAGIHFEMGSYLILANLVLLWLAVRFIRKDEKLIRSADRLR